MICLRMCAVCRNKFPKEELTRFVAKDGLLVIDRTGKADGRGCYLCSNEKCLSKAIKTNIVCKSLKVSVDKQAFEKLISEYADK